MKHLEIGAARALLHCGREIAFLDVREAGQFGEGHALFAVPCPYSRLELNVGALLPRLSVPVLLVDGGDGVAERAAIRLEAMGYADIAVASGGMPAWAAAGFPVYKGVNVPSKTLGELAEELWHPRRLQPAELARWMREGRDFAFFDTRPPAEYAKMRIPGAVCLPNGEVAHRLDALPANKPLLLTCAGRTRGIIGAVGMTIAGAGERVVALENGTQGWALSGRTLERGNTADPYPQLDAAQLAGSRARGEAVMARWSIPHADAAQVAAMLDDPTRTTYLFDVRSAEESIGDPVAAAVPAIGVQLVQATDQWVGVRRARVLLCCDTGLRAAIAAFWLHQLGYEPHVAVIDDALRALPARRPAASAPASRVETVPPSRVLARLGAGARLIDLRPSQDYRAGHLAGAIWTNRARLASLQERIGPGSEVYLVAESEAAAALVTLDLREAGHRRLAIVRGGLQALASAGGAIEATPALPADADCVDFLFFVHDRHDGNLESSRRYLAWETGLVAQLDDAERDEYRLLAPD